jgi:mRNA interferase YafQ
MLTKKTMKKFEKDLDKAKRQHKNFDTLKQIMKTLAEEKSLNSKYLDHPLKGQWAGCRECHVENDRLLVYRVLKEEHEIWFERLRSHSELFK